MKKTIWKTTGFLMLISVMIVLNSTEAFASNGEKLINAWNAFILEYRIVLAYFTGIGALTSVLIFIYHMVQLANLSAHPIKRRESMMNILVSLICTSLLGGLGIITGLFYQILLM